MTDFIIRDAEVADVPQIAAILNQQILDSVASFRMQPLDDAAALRWYAEHVDTLFPVLVAQAASDRSDRSDRSDTASPKIAGWASLSAWSHYEAYARTAEISLWIRPEFQRKGLGRRLMQGLIDRATGLEYRVLLSRIEAENVGSLKLHQQFGFRTIGTMHRVGEKHGRLLDVVMLERMLDQDDSVSDA